MTHRVYDITLVQYKAGLCHFVTRTIYANAGLFLLAQTIGPTGPFMLDIFGPAGPSMYPDQIFCYRDSTTQCCINNRTSHRSKANALFHKVYARTL